MIDKETVNIYKHPPGTHTYCMYKYNEEHKYEIYDSLNVKRYENENTK